MKRSALGWLIVVGAMLVVSLALALVNRPGTTSASPYPPRTEADLRGLADASALRLGLIGRTWNSACGINTQIGVLVPPGVDGRQEVAALLHVFYANHLDRPPSYCASSRMVFGYRKPSGTLYDAGRVMLDSSADGQDVVTIDVDAAPFQRGKPEYTVGFTP